MHVIIPVAGYGTRLRPHTYSKPKPLLQVAGNTILGHILDSLQDVGVEEITFITGYLGEQIRRYMADDYPEFQVNFVEQQERRGQAHAIHLAREHVSGPVLIIFCDTISDADLAGLGDSVHDGVVFTRQVEDPRRFGVVTTDGQNVIDRFVEKPQEFVSDRALIGVYYIKDYAGLFSSIERLMADDPPTGNEYFLADALQRMVDEGGALEARDVSVWEDCGTPDALLQTNRYMLEHGGAATVHEVGENCVIIPPVHIAKNVHLTNSVIGPYVSLAEGCEVRDAILRDTIVDANAVIEDTMMSESLIGTHAIVRGRYRALNVGDSAVVDFTAPRG